MSFTRAGKFTAKLNRRFGALFAGFLGFLVLMSILSAVGVPDAIIRSMFIGVIVAIYAVIGVMSRTMQVREYFVAGRNVPAAYNGMAAGADWLSSAAFIGMAGAAYLAGYDGLTFVVGLSGGFVLIAVLIAPYLRKSGAYTVSDFLAARYGGNRVRAASMVVLIACSFVLVVAQIQALGLVAGRFLGLDYAIAVAAGVGAIVVCTLPGGMRAVTWIQVAQYLVLLIAFLVPAIWVSMLLTGMPLPHLMQEEARGVAAGRTQDTLNLVLFTLCLMTGTASLPHLLTRYLATTSVREARSSVAWSLLFVAVVVTTAPAYAAFLAWPMPDLAETGLTRIAAPDTTGTPFVITALVATGALVATLAATSGLLFTIASAIGHDGYYAMLDRNAPSGRRLIVARVLLILVACAAAFAALRKPADILSMVTWAFSLAAAGLFPALVLGIWWKRANAWGALVGMIAGFGVCLYYLVATRYGAVEFFDVWGALSSATPDENARFAELKAAWAIAHSEAKDAARAALEDHARTIANWGGVSPLAAAAFGLPAGFAATIVVSLLTKAPAGETRDFVDALRIPRGEPPLDEKAS